MNFLEWRDCLLACAGVERDDSRGTETDAETESESDPCQDACDRRLAAGTMNFLEWRDCMLACAGVERDDTCPGVLSPPSGWTSSCDMKGTSSECDLYCGDFTRDGDDFDTMDTSDIDELVDIDSAFTPSETALLKHAWALLYENQDLVEWARCWVRGSDPIRETCLVERIQGEWENVSVVKDWDSSGGDANAETTLPFTYVGGGRIKLYVNPGRGFSNASEIWRADETNSVGAHIGRMCASIYVAVLLLHELVHVCWALRAVGDDPGECEVTYLIYNAFGWGLLNRYPQAAESLCCKDLAKESTFGSSDSFVLDTDCISASTSSAVSTACLMACSEEHAGDVEAIKRCWADRCY